jgi:NAD-dependent SIR2 family protein deacetylase
MTNPVPENKCCNYVQPSRNAYGEFKCLNCNAELDEPVRNTQPPVPEMPDCAQCQYSLINRFTLMCYRGLVRPRCTNGSEFKPAEPIRLYTITSEDKT